MPVADEDFEASMSFCRFGWFVFWRGGHVMSPVGVMETAIRISRLSSRTSCSQGLPRHHMSTSAPVLNLAVNRRYGEYASINVVQGVVHRRDFQP